MRPLPRRTLPLAAVAAAAALLPAAPAQASCADLSPAQLRRMADVVFRGKAIRVADGVATFRVSRWIKGPGRASTVKVRTGPGGNRITSVDLRIRKGERWHIQADRSRRGRLSTNACSGSHRLR